MIHKKNIFTEYHHTSRGMARNGKSKGQLDIEYCINHSGLSLKKKYLTTKHIIRAIEGKDIFTEEELKKYFIPLWRQKIITEEQAENILNLSKGILPKHEAATVAPKMPEFKETKPKVQIKTPRYDKLMLEMQEKSATRMEAYNNRNKSGRPISKKTAEDDENSDKISNSKFIDSNNKFGRGASKKFADNDNSERAPEDDMTGNIKLTRIAHNNFPQSRPKG
ncbi:hypothetical protein KKB43_03120 [Patescibacteria group bacterium]|nr:hypothetical protein [Patescibacteria group bacterium]MBU4579985.1 hypothetical protein [Patescibacteria group bacterium]